MVRIATDYIDGRWLTVAHVPGGAQHGPQSTVTRLTDGRHRARYQNGKRVIQFYLFKVRCWCPSRRAEMIHLCHNMIRISIYMCLKTLRICTSKKTVQFPTLMHAKLQYPRPLPIYLRSDFDRQPQAKCHGIM